MPLYEPAHVPLRAHVPGGAMRRACARPLLVESGAKWILPLLGPALLLAACARPTTTSIAEEHAPSALRAFDQEFLGWTDCFHVSSASLAVMRDDRLVLARGYGWRRAGERVDIWSLSKAITGVCIATLIRERKITLEDPIGPLLSPLYARYGTPADARFARITIADLLTHRGGWPRQPGGNGFAPGLPQLLQQRSVRSVSADALMTEILRFPLSRDPGVEYEYSNVGYLLLGQIIEVRTGQKYADACGGRVLARAGIRNAALDSTWGGVLHSAGGWSLSGPEYLAFLRLLRQRQPDVLPSEVRAWLTDPQGKWIDASGGRAYTLGVMLRMPARNLFHGGSWTWRQSGTRDGTIATKEGTWAVLASDGTAWFASFDTVNADENSDAIRALDATLWRAREAVSSWPERDLFAEFGVGPVTIND
jgi:CubicO group peptidase (beta-lactamase class C family)